MTNYQTTSFNLETFHPFAKFRSFLHSLSRILKRGVQQGARPTNKVVPGKTDEYEPLHDYQPDERGTVSFEDAGNLIIISRNAERMRSTRTWLETVPVCNSL